MRKLLCSSIGIVGMLVISIIAFDNSKKTGVVEGIETTPNITPMEQVTVTEQETVPKSTEEPYVSKIGSMDWDVEDAYLLAKIAMAEAEDQDTEGKALVILVVLNRVWDSNFPDTIEDVIYQKNQFSPVGNGRFDEVELDEDCWGALELVQVEHWDKSNGALYFESRSESTWHARNLEFLFQYGNHYFYTERGSRE